MKDKVIVVSLNRVATQSTQDFLIQLGYDCMHWGGIYVHPKIANLFSIEEMKELIMTYEEKWTAFTDIPYNTMYEEFYTKYPDAKFIMLNRSAESWRESLKATYKNFKREKLDIYDKMLFWKYLETKPELIEDISDQDYLLVHERHTNAVLEFFKDKPNFLNLELTDPDIEHKLYEFLNIKNDNATFRKVDNMKNWKWTRRDPDWIN